MTRTRLLRLLERSPDRRVVSLVAPPGYGKTTTLAQWATSDTRPVVWLTADDGHNDTVALLTDLATAFGRHMPVATGTFDAIRSPGMSSYSVASRLLAAVGVPTPLLVVIDDAHRLTDRSCLDALGDLIARVPGAWQVALAGRHEIALPLGRWRAQDTLLEIGVEELAMDDQEVTDLVRSVGLRIPASALRELTRSSEGWPALVYLATLRAVRSDHPDPPVASGREAFVADYLRSELLDGRSDSDVAFLTRTSILEKLDGPVCDAVLDGQGSAAILEGLGRSTLLVAEAGGWFRYHSLMREFLRAELERREPERLVELHRRAADWYRNHGPIDSAVEHAFAGHDLDGAAADIAGVALQYHWSGRRATVRAWLARFGDSELEKRPWLAVIGAIEEAGVGDVAAAERLGAIVERGAFSGQPPDGAASLQSGRLMLRALLCQAGATDMLTNATQAVGLEVAGSAWRDVALFTLAFARLISGDPEGADDVLGDTVAAAAVNHRFGTWQCALAERALLAIERGDWARATLYAEAAGAIVADAHLDGYQVTALTRASLARIAIRRGDLTAAHEQLAYSTILRPQLTASIPWLNVTALIELARAFLAVGDAAGARTLLAQANDILRLRPDLGVLPKAVVDLHAQIASLPIALRGASTLTAAELRVLAYLPLYLSFKEIGQRLGVKASTVQTHAVAIYGKLGASSRGEAVDLAIQAGLLEGLPNWDAASHQPWDAWRREAT